MRVEVRHATIVPAHLGMAGSRMEHRLDHAVFLLLKHLICVWRMHRVWPDIAFVVPRKCSHVPPVPVIPHSDPQVRGGTPRSRLSHLQVFLSGSRGAHRSCAKATRSANHSARRVGLALSGSPLRSPLRWICEASSGSPSPLARSASAIDSSIGSSGARSFGWGSFGVCWASFR